MSAGQGGTMGGLSVAEAMLEGEILSFSPKGKAGAMALGEGLRAKRAVSAAKAALGAVWRKRVDAALLADVLGALSRGKFASRGEALAEYNGAAAARAREFRDGTGPLPLDAGEFEALREASADEWSR